MKSIIKTGDFTIQRSLKNTEFEDRFPLKDADKRKILDSLVAEECIKIDRNNNSRYEDADVFIFLKDTLVFVYGEEEHLQLYIKMYIRENKSYDVVIVISFHEAGIHE